MANTKLKKTELKQLADIQERKQSVVFELGQIEEIKIQANARRDNALRFMQETSKIELGLVKQLEETYGKGVIDLEKGEFIPQT